MIWLLGDVHGNFDHVLETVAKAGERPAAVVFLGDLECPRPFSECVAEIEAAGIQCWAIPGNHDTDSAEAYLNLWGDTLFQERNLHGRIVEIDGLRVAVWGRNITDTTYYATHFAFGDVAVAMFGDPRAYGLDISMRF